MIAPPNDPWSFGWDQLLGLANLAAISTGIYIARDTFRKWQHERIANRQCEVAENAISIVYEAKIVFQGIRSPSFAGEGYKEIFERINQNKEFWERVLRARILVKVYFGDRVLERFDTILDLRKDLWFAAFRLRRRYEQLTGSEGERADRMEAEIQELEDFAWEADPAKDSFSKRLSDATTGIEVALLPIVRKFKEPRTA